MPLDALAEGDIADQEICLPSLCAATSRKARGAYYTPDAVAASLCRWAVTSDDDFLLDPACGDGQFITRHRNSIGVDQDPKAVHEACERAPHALVLQADFFQWAAETEYRFDCVVGNPPFIRYQRFAGEARRQALALCANRGVMLSGLASAWAPFLVIAASLLKQGGKAAFVVPAEIGHAPYAAPVMEYFVRHFGGVHVIAIREKLFPNLSEDCWLLYAENFGGHTDEIRFSALDSFLPTGGLPANAARISVHEWKCTWKCRLRPFLMPPRVRSLYQRVAADKMTQRLGDLASIGIGYVSGANDFFHLRPSKAAQLDLPHFLLRPTLRNSRYLDKDGVSSHLVEQWLRDDEPILLLDIPKLMKDVPGCLYSYLDSAEGLQARLSYKCRHRTPWYSVPDVRIPEFFLTYLSGREVGLARNEAGITCTNALHYVCLKEPRWGAYIAQLWQHPFTQLSCEIEGHPLGGGLLKLEPREASAILLTSANHISCQDIDEGITSLRTWRHYGDAE